MMTVLGMRILPTIVLPVNLSDSSAELSGSCA